MRHTKGLTMTMHRFSSSYFCLIFIAIAGFVTPLLEASYINVYSGNDNGGIAFTGNTLGLDKRNNQNLPGVSGSIGAFISTNPLLQVPGWPAGTTLLYAQNSSSAVLDLPPGSVVLHAELIWGGSYGFGSTVSSSDMSSITLITPDSAMHTITPKVATAQAGPLTFDPSLPSGPSGGMYSRSQDVTTILTGLPTVTGTYIVGGVPASVQPLANNLNCAGWTLAVAYHNPHMFTSNLNLYTACEASGPTADPAALVSGFLAPAAGNVSARLFVSALEGDAFITGDHLVIGNAVNVNHDIVGGTNLSGTNNPVNNFFADQINTILTITTDLATGKFVQSGSSVLDTRGSFGNSNSNASTATDVSGARQGYDITSVNLGGLIANGETQVYVQGTSTQDVYTITALGMQIQVTAPLIQSVKSVNPTSGSLGTFVTFTETFTNVGEITATSVVLKDVLQSPGLSFVAGSFLPDNTVTYTDLSVTGVPLPDLPVNGSTTISFRAQITDVNILPRILYNAGTVSYTYAPGGQTFVSQTNTVQISLPTIPAPVANDDFVSTNVNTVLNNATSILANDTGTGITVISNTLPSHGSIFMRPSGLFTYAPDPNYSGADSFQYTIGDAASPQQTAPPATVHITVYPVANADIASVTANTLLTQTTSVLNNDGGSGLHISSWESTSDAGGVVTMTSGGLYTYMPPTDFSGTDVFDYTAVDTPLGNLTSTTVTITVFPIADDDHLQTPVNQVLNGLVSAHGTGITITFPGATMQGGTVTNTTPNGDFTYTPPLNYSGPDSFVYTAKDAGGNQTMATVYITVIPIGVNDSASTHVNISVSPALSVLSNDIGTNLTISMFDIATVQGGTVSMTLTGVNAGKYTYTPPSNFTGVDSFTYFLTDGTSTVGPIQVKITVFPIAVNDTYQTPANTSLNATSVLANDIPANVLMISTWDNPTTQNGSVAMNKNGTFTYVPPLNFSGIDTFTYTAVDSSGDPSGATVTIYVIPVAVDDTQTTPENTPFNGPSVLANDIGTELSIATYIPGTSAGGMVVMNLVTGTYLYTPPTGFVGKDNFSYTIMDSSGDGQTASAVVTILVTPIPQPTYFTGYVKECKLLNRTDYRLVAKWGAAPFPNIASYRIYNNGKVVAQIPAGQPLVFSQCLKSKHSADNYSLVAVSSMNAESPPLKIRIIYE